MRDTFSEENSVQLSKAICEHLLREGRMDVAETLINVSYAPSSVGIHVSLCMFCGVRMDGEEVLLVRSNLFGSHANQESGLSHHENFISMFTEIHHIAQSLRSKEVELALE